MDLTARTYMHGRVVDTAQEQIGRFGGARIAPRQNRGQRPAALVDGEQAVAEAGPPDRVDSIRAARLLDRGACMREDLSRVVFPRVIAPRERAPLLGGFVETAGPHG